MRNPSIEILEKWRKNPNNWKWGCLYYNKEDQRLFPPKRIPWMGWTINFANWKSILAFLLVLGSILLLILIGEALNFLPK
jgi:uncharacterized membrane protein